MSDGAETGVTTHFPLKAGIARAGGFSITGRVDGRFLGEDAGDFQIAFFFSQWKAIVIFKFGAQVGEQGVSLRPGEVRNFYFGRVRPSSGSPAGDERMFAAVAGGDEVCLGREGVNSINNDVRRGSKKLFRVSFRIKIVQRDDFRFGINIPDSDRHGFCLGLTDGCSQRVDLPVGIGNAKVVQVHQDNGTHARPRQRFRRPGSYSSNADDGHAGVPEGVQSSGSV